MLPGSGQAASHRHGVGGGKWIALSIDHSIRGKLTGRRDIRLRRCGIGAAATLSGVEGGNMCVVLQSTPVPSEPCHAMLPSPLCIRNCGNSINVCDRECRPARLQDA